MKAQKKAMRIVGGWRGRYNAKRAMKCLKLWRWARNYRSEDTQKKILDLLLGQAERYAQMGIQGAHRWLEHNAEQAKRR